MTYLINNNNIVVIRAKIKKDGAPITFCIVGKAMPIMKFPPQFAILPKAMALGRGPTSKSSEPIK